MTKQKLTPEGVERAAEQLSRSDAQVPAAAIWAFAEVEAPTGGFDSSGQPRILFEGHKFSEFTGGQYDQSHPNISYPRWDRTKYAKGPTPDARNQAEHRRLQEAERLNRFAALKSASWGRFQLMGFNYQACGFPSIQSFINAMYASEDAQLQAFVKFMQTDRGGKGARLLREAVKTEKWGPLAEFYNGAGYRDNGYDTKLAAAYERYSR